MRTYQLVLPLLLGSAIMALGQAVVSRQVLAGSGVDTPAAVAVDSQGYVYVAGVTTAANFPVANALEPHPPQAALEVSVNGSPFVNSGLVASTNLNAQGVTAVAASSNGMLVIVSAFGGSYRSIDGGASWKPTADPVAQALALAVDPVDASNACAILPGGALYRSSNGGVNWQASGTTLPPPVNNHGVGLTQLAINPRQPATLYALYYSHVFRSTDGAQSWQPLPIPVAVSAFALAPSQPDILYAASLINLALYVSADGGSTWTAAASSVSGLSATGLAVDPADASTLWVAGGDGLRKSTDGGATLQTVSTPAGYGFYSVAIDPAKSSRIYLSANNPFPGGILESSDGGATWLSVYTGYSQSLYAAPSRIFAYCGSVPQTVFLAKFDPALSQVIYSTYLWTGSIAGMAVDGQGNVALTGSIQGVSGVVMKVSAEDSSVLYSTLLPGTAPNAIALDTGGNAVIAGTAINLAVTKGAFESTLPGSCSTPPLINGIDTTLPPAFAAKLDTNGAVVYATYVAGSCGDSAYGLAVDSAGAAYLAGETYSPDFPVTQNAMTAKLPGFAPSGFLVKLSSAGDLLYLSFLGGSYTAAHAVTLDPAGSIYVAGSTYAKPTAGAWQALSGGVGCNTAPVIIGPPQPPMVGNAFVLKMTPSAAPAAFLATVGGSCTGAADSIALDAAGDIWLAGYNGSVDFVTRAPIAGLGQLTQLGPVIFPFTPVVSSGFLAELDPTASTLLSASVTDYYGSVATDSRGVYYAGPLGTSALVAEINPAPTAPLFVDEIVQYSPLLPPAWRAPSSVAPGEIVRILGRGIGPQNEAKAKLTATGTLSTSIGGVQVTFNGVLAPLVTAQTDQIVCIAPFGLEGLTTAVVEVQYNGQTSNKYTVGVVPQNPDITAVTNSDWSVNSASNPAKPGSQVTVFLTGLGQTIPPSRDGAINQTPPAQLQTVPTISFPNAPANVAFLGAAAFEVAGVSQFNMTLPRPAVSPFAVYFGNVAPAYVYVGQ